jgi:tyrosinase
MNRQIDRWFAIWQAAHPDRWFEGQFVERVNGSQKRSQIAPLAKEDALPFVHPSGSYWNGNLSKKTQDFGYIYKEALGTAQEVKDRFAKLYSWSVRSKTESGDYEAPPPEMEPLNVNSAQVFQYTAASVSNRLMSMAAAAAPQVVMQAMETSTKVASEVVGSSAPKAETSSANVDPVPAAPGTRADGAAFTNFEPTAETEAPAKSIDESKYARDWYVDNVVER